MKKLTVTRLLFRLAILPLLLCFSFAQAQIFADFNMDKTGGCSPLAVSFTNFSSGASANAVYSWDFGNGNTSTLKNPSAIYIEEKAYTITLTVTDGNLSSTKTKTITVYKKPVPDFSVPSAKVCLPQSVQFNTSGSAGDGFISGYQWDFGDGTTQQGFGSQMSHFYSYEMIPAVSLTVTNSFGCHASITKTNLVEILPKIDPVFTVDKTMLCSLNDSIRLTNSSTGPGSLLYSWNFDDGTTSSQKDPVHQFNRKAVYQVRLTVSNTVGCSATSFPVGVNAAYFNTDFNSQLLCRQVGFTGTSFLFPSSSVWNFGDGITSNGFFNISHTYATAGNYSVTLINSYNSCKDTVVKTIAVQDLVNFNSDINMPASVCKDAQVSFTNTSTVNPGSMNWTFGDGATASTSFSPVYHNYSQSGTYTVKLLNTFGTCSETVTKTIVVNDLPKTGGFIADFGGVCGSPVTVTFKDTAATATSWQWRMDNFFNPTFSTQKNAPYLFSSNGFHTVYLTVTNAAGCNTTVSRTINIEAPSASIYFSYSSSPKGYYDCDSLTLKFGVNSNQQIQSYSWNLGNGQTSTLPDPMAKYDQIGVYDVVLNYVTESGCSGVAHFAPRVYGKPKADFSYSIPCGNALDLAFRDASPFSDDWQWRFGDGGLYFWTNPVHTYADTGKYNMTFINHIGHCADTIVKAVYANILPSSINIIKAENTCEGNRGTVTFDQQSVRMNGGTWDFGDGTLIPYDSSVHVIKHSYAATGSYTVRLTSTYGNCTLTSSRTVIVLLEQNPQLTANLTQICANGSLNVQLSGMQVNPFSGSFTWGQYYVNKFEYSDGTQFVGSISNYDFQNTNYNATLQNFTAGTSRIRMIINDGNTTCKDTSNYINVQVNGPIAGFYVSNNNSCYKSPFVFVDTSRSSTNTPLTSWRWDFGDGASVQNATGAQVTHTYTGPGNYFVRLTVTDATGCSKTVTGTANARGPKAAFTISGLFVPNVPLNTTVSFFNNSFANSGSVDYTWYYGDGATSNNFSGSHTYTQPAINTVLLIAKDASINCADTARQVITVKDFNTAFSFTSSFIGAGSCPPVLVRINNLSVGFTRLLWDFGDGTGSTQYYPSHTYYEPGTYRIILYTYGFNGLTGTYIDSVQVSKPAAQISADILKGCIQQQVNLSASTQNAASYLWDFGDGNVTSSSGLSHSYISPGIYNPRLIVKDANGCQASSRLADSVVIDSLSIAIKGIPPLVCDSALIQFTPDVKSFAAAKLGTALTYKWDFGTGNAADTANVRDASFRFKTPGTYIVRFSVNSPFGCTKEVTATVVVNQKAHGAITGLTETCEQVPVQFKATATPADNVQWQWNFANGNTTSQQDPSSQVYSTPGIYPVMLIVTRNGCIDTTIHQLTVNGKPVINAQPRQQVLCLGNSVQFSSGGGGTYSWTPSAGLNNGAIANPIASPVISTVYKLQVTSDKGCVNTDSISITVAQPIKLQLPSSADICKGMSTQLTATGATSYQWINNTTGLNSTSISNPIAKPASTTTYMVVGADAYNCFKDTVSIVVAVHDLPTVNAGPDVELQGDIPYTLTATSSNDVTNWLWTPANSLSCSNCSSPIATPKMETRYIVRVNNSWGCAAYDTVLVKLKCAIDNVRIPDGFTPNNDGLNDLFYIKGSGVKIIRYLRIYDRWGAIVFEKTNFGIDDRSSGWDGKIKGIPAATGSYVYFTELECSSGELFRFKGTVTVIR